MNQNFEIIKNGLQDILRGKGKISNGTLIQTITNYLRESKETISLAETDKYYKQKETKKLIELINEKQLWIHNFDFDLFISEGAEQKVYIKDGKTVFKLNDSIYYSTWEDYFRNLLLNNYFFPDTAYQLNGFIEKDNVLYALVEQKFVEANEATDLEKVKLFMKSNGFENIRNHDYFHPTLGIILEDLHDENVLTQNGILYFIDTVFYIKPNIFWK